MDFKKMTFKKHLRSWAFIGSTKAYLFINGYFETCTVKSTLWDKPQITLSLRMNKLLTYLLTHNQGMVNQVYLLDIYKCH